jgi:hypothetical protein
MSDRILRDLNHYREEYVVIDWPAYAVSQNISEETARGLTLSRIRALERKLDEAQSKK